MPNEKEKGDGSSCVPVRSRKVFEPLEFFGYVLGRDHAVAHEVMNLKLCLLVSVDPEPTKQFIDVTEGALHEHLHERYEVRAIKCCCSFCNKPRHLLGIQNSELGVLRHQLPTVGRPRSHSIGGGVIHSEVCMSSRPLEIVLFFEEASEELLGIGGELLDGLVFIGDKLCGNKVLLSWSL